MQKPTLIADQQSGCEKKSVQVFMHASKNQQLCSLQIQQDRALSKQGRRSNQYAFARMKGNVMWIVIMRDAGVSLVYTSLTQT